MSHTVSTKKTLNPVNRASTKPSRRRRRPPRCPDLAVVVGIIRIIIEVAQWLSQ